MNAAPAPEPERIERLDCWECDGPTRHRTTPALGQRRHECLVCGAVWWSHPSLRELLGWPPPDGSH